MNAVCAQVSDVLLPVDQAPLMLGTPLTVLAEVYKFLGAEQAIFADFPPDTGVGSDANLGSEEGVEADNNPGSDSPGDGIRPLTDAGRPLDDSKQPASSDVGSTGGTPSTRGDAGSPEGSMQRPGSEGSDSVSGPGVRPRRANT